MQKQSKAITFINTITLEIKAIPLFIYLLIYLAGKQKVIHYGD